jgi:hypothetical protein
MDYYFPTMRVVRNTERSRFPSFLGLFRSKSRSQPTGPALTVPLSQADDEQDPQTSFTG